jgi:Skp family chaperone for outer membrane proteins
MPVFCRLPCLLLALLAACGAPPGRPSGGAGGTGRVAVVDVARIIEETERGREIMATLEEAQGQAVSQLEDMRADLEAIAEEIEAAQSAETPDEADVRRLVGEYQEAAGRAQQAQAAAQAQLEEYRRQLTEPLVADVRLACERIGRDDGYDLIVDRGGIPYVEDAIDITDRIIRELDDGSSATLVREAMRTSGGEDEAEAEEEEEEAQE